MRLDATGPGCFREATMRRGIRDEGDHKQQPPPNHATPHPRSEAARRAGAAGGAFDRGF